MVFLCMYSKQHRRNNFVLKKQSLQALSQTKRIFTYDRNMKDHLDKIIKAIQKKRTAQKEQRAQPDFIRS